MKSKLVTLFSAVLLLCMIFSTNILAASTGRDTYYLWKNQQWTKSEHLTRSGASVKTYARCIAVYPTNGGEDNYKRVRTRIETTYNTVISDVYTLTETSKVNEEVVIKDGYLANKQIKFAFSGNNPDLDAYADLAYDAN